MWIYQRRTTLGSWDGQKEHAVVVRSTFPSQNVQITSGSEHFSKLRCRNSARLFVRSAFPSQNVKKKPCPDWRFRCRFAWQAQGILHLAKSEQKREGFVAVSAATTTTLHYTTLHYTTEHKTTQHNTNYNYRDNDAYITLFFPTLVTLHYAAPLHTVHYATLRYTNYSYNYKYTTWHYTTPEYTTVHYATLHYITLHYTH